MYLYSINIYTTKCKIKTITRDKEEHYLVIKGSIQEEDVTVVNIYVPNIGAPQNLRQTLTAIKGEIDSNRGQASVFLPIPLVCSNGR